MNYSEIIQKYKDSGLICLPTGTSKAPSVNSEEDWKNGFDPSRFIDCHGIGIVCGKLSGGLECIDFDNHAEDAKANLAAFMDIPEVKEIYDKYKLPIESTVSGGYHFLFRCEHNDGNLKLATKLLNGKPDCFIETRGQGGYFCADPTPGYKIIRNDILNIATISTLERAILIDNAKSFNQHIPVIPKTEYESNERPGDLYNSSASANGDMKSILSSYGWTDLGNMRWRRPGKKTGISATLGKVAPNVFYVFSSNCSPFENNKGYSPFQVLALLKFNGDFSEAAKSIAPERERKVTKSELPISEIEKFLNGALIDTRKHIEKPPTILSVFEANASRYEEKRIFTLGNFSCIIGKAKSKKTFLISLLSASLLNECNDILKGSLPDHKNMILYFDTEQGEYDSYNVIRRIERMSTQSNRLMAFNLRPFSPIERCQIIQYAFKIYGEKVGYCVIDGVADLANGINDEEEATRVVTLLLQWSKIYNCHISTVIHQNKNDEFATGHLGSSVMKKAEIIISVTKSDVNESIIKCDMSRAQGFEELRMTISHEGFPEIYGNKPKVKAAFYDKKELTVDQMEF